jgi:hypothetical protein
MVEKHIRDHPASWNANGAAVVFDATIKGCLDLMH